MFLRINWTAFRIYYRNYTSYASSLAPRLHIAPLTIKPTKVKKISLKKIRNRNHAPPDSSISFVNKIKKLDSSSL